MKAVLPLIAAPLLATAPPVPQGAAIPVHVGGRTVPDESGAMRFGWPGVYFEGRFRGTGVEVSAETGTEFLRLLVDGEEKAVLKRPGRASLQVRGLTPGEHVVRLEKLTESQSGGGRFLGFRALDGGEPLAPAPRSRAIEFIGDSYTVGYGNASPGRTCTREEVHDFSDTQRAFGPLVARRLGADYRMVAYSGFGIVRNYNGGNPGLSLPAIYPRLIPGDAAPVEKGSNGWRPQLIVVNLGTNDFSTPVHAGERWRDQAELRGDYRRRYAAFLRELMAKQPQARFLLMGSDAFYEDVRQVAAAVASPGRPPVATVRFGDLELTGCDWHPSLKDDAALAGLIEAEIAKMPGLWGAAR